MDEHRTVEHAREVVTDRLVLRAITTEDFEPLYALHSDPEVWRHLPSERHTHPAQTRVLVDAAVAGWDRRGLDYWTVRELEDPATVAGIGGCRLVTADRWNLYYRLVPIVHGRGYATELGHAALAAAHTVRADAAVTASVLERNPASCRVADRLGMTVVWRGEDIAHETVALLYADRPVDRAVAAEWMQRR